VSAHVVILLVSEPLLLEHLKPTAPPYMLAGLGASVLLFVLVISSITRWRRRLWPDYRRFKWQHAWLAVICLLLACWHVVASDFYLNSTVKLVVGILVVIGIFARYLWVRFMTHGRGRGSHRIRNTAAYSHPISYGALILLLIAVFLLAAVGNGAEPSIARGI
jgi:DMSO/TMAO reductase YedYZ heme-binding membrane subunit